MRWADIHVGTFRFSLPLLAAFCLLSSVLLVRPACLQLSVTPCSPNIVHLFNWFWPKGGSANSVCEHRCHIEPSHKAQ